MSYKNFYEKSAAKSYNKKKKPSKPTRQRIGDYQLFIGAFPTGELADQIQRIRGEVDGKSITIVDPHVTVAGTYWRNGKATRAGAQGLIDRLDRLSPKLKSFELDMGGVYTFGKRVIYLGVRPTDPLLAIRAHLVNTIGEDKHRRFRPHLTLALDLEDASFAAALAELKEGELGNGRFSAPIAELRLMQRAEGEHAWRVIHTIALG